MTHVKRIEASYEKGGHLTETWKIKHREVVRGAQPLATAEPVALLAWSLAKYADNHRARYSSKLGDDGFLGPVWETAVHAAMDLLNGETGGLDCGTMDKLFRDMLEAEGFDRDQ